MNKDNAWTDDRIKALEAFDEEQRLGDQREEVHRSRFMKNGDIGVKRSSFGENVDGVSIPHSGYRFSAE